MFCVFFGGLYGYTMNVNPGADVGGVKKDFALLYHIPFSNLWDGALNPEQSADIFSPLLWTILSRFTDDGNIAIMVTGLIGFSFFVCAVNLIVKYMPNQIQALQMLILIAIIVTSPFSTLGGVRTFVARYLFWMAFLLYFSTNEKRYLILVCLTPFVHFSFVPIVGFALLPIFFRKRTGVLYWIFFGSFIFQGFDIGSLVTKYFEGGVVEKKALGYTSNEYNSDLEEMGGQMNWYVQYYRIVMQYYLLGAVWLLWMKLKKVCLSDITRNLFLLYISLYSFFNIVSTVVVFSARMNVLVTMIGLSFIAYAYTDDKTGYVKKVVMIGLPIFILFILVCIRVFQVTISPSLLYQNLIVLLLYPGN